MITERVYTIVAFIMALPILLVVGNFLLTLLFAFIAGVAIAILMAGEWVVSCLRI